MVKDSELINRLKQARLGFAAVGETEMEELANDAIQRIRELEEELVNMAVTMTYLRPSKGKL